MSNSSRHVYAKFSSDSLVICGFVPKNGFFVLKECLSIPFDKNLTRILKSGNGEHYITKCITESGFSLFEYDTLSVSFPCHYGLLKSVKVDKKIEKKFEIEHLKWEFEQISNRPISDFSFLFPTNYSTQNDRPLLALYKQLIELSKSLSSKFNLTLNHVSFSLLVYLNHLVNAKAVNSKSNVILINIESNFVEIGFYFHGIIQSFHTIEIAADASINIIQIELRSMLDSYISNNDNLKFQKIYLTGDAVNLDDTKHLSEFLHTSIELTNPIHKIKHVIKKSKKMNYDFIDDDSHLLNTNVSEASSTETSITLESMEREVPKHNPFYPSKNSDQTTHSDLSENDDLPDKKKKNKIIFLTLFALIFIVITYFLLSFAFSKSDIEEPVSTVVKKDSIKVKPIPKRILEEAGKRYSFLKKFSSILGIRVKGAGISQIDLISNELFIEIIGTNRTTVAEFAQKLRSKFQKPLDIQFSRKRNLPNSSFIILYRVTLSSYTSADFKEIHEISLIENKIHSIAKTLNIKFQEFTTETNVGIKSFFIKALANKKDVQTFIETINSNLNNVSLLKFSTIATDLRTHSDNELLLSLRLVILN